MTASVFVIGVYREPGSDLELRFKREIDGHWKPEVVVSRLAKTVRAFPECYVPTSEIVRELDRVFERAMTNNFAA